MKNWRKFHAEKKRIRREALANFNLLHKRTGKFVNGKWQSEIPKNEKS